MMPVIKKIEELADELNGRAYTIYIDNLMKNFNKYKSQRELLMELFREAYQIEFDDTDNYSELKNRLGELADEYVQVKNLASKLRSRLTIKDLKKCNEETDEELFVISQLYLTAIKKHEAYFNLYKQLELNQNFENEISIRRHLKFSAISSQKDGKKRITIENQTFNGLNIEEIKEILGFSDYIQYETNEEIISFINRNERVFSKGFSSNYLVKGNVIYFNIYESEIGL
jgi:hypothetical protein